MSVRVRNVRPKPGYMFDGAQVLPMRSPFQDGALANILTGRGTSVDRGAHNFWTGVSMTAQQIETAYRFSWLVRQIVDIPADDQTRAGRDWEADDDEISAIEKEEKRIGYWAKVRTALIYGRLGGGALFINLGDDPASPLPNTVRPEQIVSLVPLYRTHLSIGTMDDDLLSPYYGEPTVFRVNTPATPIIHPSRLIIFKGQLVPGMHYASWEDRFWGDSVVQTVDEAVKNATTATAGFASLIDEAKVDVFTFKGMIEQLSQPGGEEIFMKRLQVTATGKSIHRMVALGEGDTWETRQLNWAGMPDIIKTYLSIVAGAADIPATRLLGKSPDGMNATGEGDLSNYFQSISAQQETDLRPALERLDAVVLPSAGVKADLPWSFSPLRVLTEQQQADIENKEAMSVTQYANSGLIPESALAKSVQNRLIESQRWPGLKVAIEEAEAVGEELPDDDPSEIVPINGKEAGPNLAGRGGSNGSESPARRAANDASPRTLYVRRDLLNASEFIAWAKAQGFDTTLSADDLHVTITYSKTPVDWMKMGATWEGNDKGELVVQPGGARIVEPLGDKGAVVLLFASSSLSWRHEEMIRNGASHDFPEYQPHCTITYAKPDGLDLSKIEPFRGALKFGPEIFEELDEDWAGKLTEAD